LDINKLLKRNAQIQNLNSKQIIKQWYFNLVAALLLRKVKAELNKEIQRVRPISGIKEALIELKNQGNRLEF